MPDGTGVLHAATPRQRHALLRVDPDTWPAILAGHPWAHIPLLASWAASGWPVIVRRCAEEDHPGEIPVGVPLPPAQGKLRIALCVPQASVTAQEDLPGLDAAAPIAPSSWRRGIDALLALGDRFGVAPTCFGSLCWEVRTGLSYITATSDLDVVWTVGAGTDIPALLDAIAGTERAFGPRIDGEIVFAGDRAVNWRELHNALRPDGADQIIVKTCDGARLVPIGTVFGAERAA